MNIRVGRLLFLPLLFFNCQSFSFPVPKTVIPLSLPDNESSNDIPPETDLLDGNVPVRARSVPIDTPEINSVKIWEVDDPSQMMQDWYSNDDETSNMVDPFGVIMWPGSILASKELVDHKCQVENSTVVVLGAGTGVEAQCAALLGASKVIALDISPLALQLLEFGAQQANVGDIVEAKQFDLFSKEALPPCDILVAADVLYNGELARQVGKRVIEVMQREMPPSLIITDSQRFHGTDFLGDVNNVFPECKPLEWKYYELKNVRGSGILIDEDQTYDSTTRMVSTGWR